MTPRRIGWAFVVAQIVLLAALALLPGRAGWPLVVQVLGVGLVVVGLVVMVAASRALGTALTPTPEPRDGDRLRTEGPYRYVRHPIYSGVLIIVVGLVVRSGSAGSLVVGAVTVAFFHAKARWEERRLSARYPEYQAYAAATGRFVPRLTPRR